MGSVASKAGAAAAPYVDRVLANEQVSKVVGNVVDASVGVGSMVTTVHATAKEKVSRLTGNTPEAAAAAAAEAQAWREVLAGGVTASGKVPPGEEIAVPARNALTMAFFVQVRTLI